MTDLETPPRLRIGYEQAAAADLLAQPDVLAVIGFGAGPDLPGDPRALRVGLEPMQDGGFEVWRCSGRVRSGYYHDLRWSCDGTQTFFAIEVDEDAHGGIIGAAEHAYRRIGAFVSASATPHLLRLWNYLDAINLGDGDAERYRLFCDGRASGMQAATQAHYPAATAIGRRDGVRTLQVYGLASARPGRAVENPRQVSAWRYPRQYGPTSPTFARGMLDAEGDLLISGTAAVVGHASAHRDDLEAQLDETFANLDSLLRQAGVTSRFGEATRLKVYVREPADNATVVERIRDRAPTLGGLLVLTGDICRSELLVEIDGFHPRYT